MWHLLAIIAHGMVLMCRKTLTNPLVKLYTLLYFAVTVSRIYRQCNLITSFIPLTPYYTRYRVILIWQYTHTAYARHQWPIITASLTQSKNGLTSRQVDPQLLTYSGASVGSFYSVRHGNRVCIAPWQPESRARFNDATSACMTSLSHDVCIRVLNNPLFA